MNEKTIQGVLMRHCMYVKKHSAMVPNSQYLLVGEADLISVTRARLVHEYEIKCSKSDYNREFKTKKWKHQVLARSSVLRCPNYFWFVTHGFEIDPPEYAGWMTVTEHKHRLGEYRLNIKKEAPRLHTGKWDVEKMAKIAHLLSYRILNQYK